MDIDPQQCESDHGIGLHAARKCLEDSWDITEPTRYLFSRIHPWRCERPGSQQSRGREFPSVMADVEDPPIDGGMQDCLNKLTNILLRCLADGRMSNERKRAQFEAVSDVF
jgi:hypothetical protein